MGRSTRIVGILVVLGIAGYGIYVQVMKWHRESLEISRERLQEAWNRESGRMEKEIKDLEAQLAVKQEPTLPEGRLAEVFGGEAKGILPEESEPSCEALDKEVREFFAYLDGKPYVQSYRLGQGTLGYFRSMLDKLSKPPGGLRGTEGSLPPGPECRPLLPGPGKTGGAPGPGCDSQRI